MQNKIYKQIQEVNKAATHFRKNNTNENILTLTIHTLNKYQEIQGIETKIDESDLVFLIGILEDNMKYTAMDGLKRVIHNYQLSITKSLEKELTNV